MADIDVLHRAHAEVGEGPVWDARSGELHWVDILRGTLWTERMDGSTPTAINVGTHLGAALPSKNPGEILLCTRFGFVRMDRETSMQVPVATPLVGTPALRFNDAKTSPEGRAFGGTMPYVTDAVPGALYRLDGGATMTKIGLPLRLANGIAWAPDGRTMYFIDSGTRTLWCSDYDPETGELHDTTALIDFDLPAGTLPDGMCVDNDGALWVALMGGGRLERYSPAGILDRTIPLPVQRPTSVCFAGPRLDVLVVTSLSYQLSPTEMIADPLAGALLALDVGVSGPAATPWDPELIGLPFTLTEESK